MSKLDVVYLAGGNGIRLNLGYPKQYMYLYSKPLLIYGLEALRKSNEINRIIIPSDNKEKIIRLLNCYNIEAFVIDGGKTRQESVYLGLKYMQSEFVLIAEAVRPFITCNLINQIISNKNDCVIPYSLLNSTPFNRLNGDLLCRKSTVMVQTPQKYRLEFLYSSHQKAIKLGISNTTDDLALMKTIGLYNNFGYIEGLVENIKITYPVDIHIAKAIFQFLKGNKSE